MTLAAPSSAGVTLAGVRAETDDRLAASEDAGSDVFEAIFRGLNAFGEQNFGTSCPRPLVVPLRDASGRAVGGLWGATDFGWLHVQMLFVPEASRGQGTGAALLGSAEAEARRRGCHGAYLDVIGAAAEPFYRRRGYTLFGVQDDFPRGQTRQFLQKRLAPAAGRDTPARGEPARGEEIAFAQALAAARQLTAAGQDAPATAAYFDLLRRDPTHFAALNELAALAYAGGHRAAARTAYGEAVRNHPGNPIGLVNLGKVVAVDGDPARARAHYEAALEIDPDLAEAHQGLATVLTELGCDGAERHRAQGFRGHAVTTRRYRGEGPALSLLLLLSAQGGNIPVSHWVNDRQFAITAVYCDYHDPAQALPPHELVVNAIGDADLCRTALSGASLVAACSPAPVINPPKLVASTGRVAVARRLGTVAGVVTPAIAVVSRAAIMHREELRFPLLLRAPGFHTGRHFLRVERRDGLAAAVAALPGDELLAIECLDARGADGYARKYRVMLIDGEPYPLHLAIAADWKVHHFTAGMADRADHRAEERRFLDDMPAILGAAAMNSIAGIAAALALDYAGIDFALRPDGSLLLFEANAAMVVAPPDRDPIWDYRRPAATAVLGAIRAMLLRRAGGDQDGRQSTTNSSS